MAVEFFQPHDVIPVGQWRMGIFVIRESVAKGFSEDSLISSIAYWAHRGGFTVSVNSLRRLALDLQVSGEPGVVFGGWVMNTVPDQTTAKFLSITKIPTLFAVETAPSEVESYLNIFQGKWAGGVLIANPRKWATPGSWLRPGVWYVAGAMWHKASPSAVELDARLKKIGCNLFDVYSKGKLVVEKHPPHGLVFQFKTPAADLTMGQITSAIGAYRMTIDLNDGNDDPDLTTWDRIAELSEEQEEAIADLGEQIVATTKDVVAGAGIATDILGSILKYGPSLALGAIVVFGGYKIYTLATRKRPAKAPVKKPAKVIKKGATA